ncbi:MAG: MBL fold metallo-hydrolase [Candidatus Nanopelagicales bacterium]
MPAAIEMTPGVFRFPTLGDYINTIAFVEDDGSVTLVDCGLKQAPPRIVAGLREIGKVPADVQRIVLTHAHNDHAGGAAEMVRRTGLQGVAAHEADADYIEAGVASPYNSSISGRVFSRSGSGGFEATPITERLVDGQLLDVAGGLSVHHTPGHSPGHISLKHERTELLITGDAIFNMVRMTWPFSATCTDHKLNRKSAHVLGELDYDVVAFTHGPHISINARETVRGFLKRKDAW